MCLGNGVSFEQLRNMMYVLNLCDSGHCDKQTVRDGSEIRETILVTIGMVRNH